MVRSMLRRLREMILRGVVVRTLVGEKFSKKAEGIEGAIVADAATSVV